MLRSYGFASLSLIPADGVEHLRELISTPGTREKDLEIWIRQYPQVISSTPSGLYPHKRILLPDETGQTWEPDILYKKTGENYFNIVELKRADKPIVSGSATGRGISITKLIPSSPPRFSNYATKAINQLEIYLIYADKFSEYLERTHTLRYLSRKE